MRKILCYFDKLADKNKIGHAYLIGNTFYQECKDELEEVISKYIFKEKVTLDSDFDIEIVQPENNNISKNQIKNMMDNLNTTSQVKGKKVYIITECDRLSKSVYNTLLKIMEEHEDNIDAFLITNNIDGVGQTIISRCQKIFISSTSSSDNNKELSKVSAELLKHFNNEDIKKLICDKNIREEFCDRKQNITYLQEMIDSLQNKLIDTNKSEQKKIIKLIMTLNNLLEKSYYNYNVDLFINKMFLDMWRCANENSGS